MTPASRSQPLIRTKEALVFGFVLLGLSYLNYNFLFSQDFPDLTNRWWAFPVAILETFAVIAIPFATMWLMDGGRVRLFGQGMSSEELESRRDELRLLASAVPPGVGGTRR